MSSYMGVQMAKGRHNGGTHDNVGDATTVRPSASANFYVDSQDKLPGQGSGDFIITKNQSLFNGFFNRISSAEIVMDWGIPNVAEHWGNTTMTVVNSTTAVQIAIQLTSAGGPANQTIPDGFYTAIQVLQQACLAINARATALGDPLRLAVQFDGLDVKAVSVGVGADPFYLLWTDGVDPPYALARQLFSTAQLAGPAVANTEITLSSPRVLGTTYIDIVSPQLTYNQELKDATTDNNSRDVLYRWYLAQDNVPHEREPFMLAYPAIAAPPAPFAVPAVQVLTPTNIPVIQGYNPFVLRRALPYPKQIRWNPAQPIGSVTFQCYDDRGRIIRTTDFPFSLTTGYGGANFQFQMSMLLSED